MSRREHDRRFAAFLRRNSALGRTIEVDAGATLFAAGEPADSVFLVEGGAVELRFEHGRKTISADGYFGELALLLESHQRSASAVAAEPSRLIEFDRAAFGDLLDRDPRLLIEVLRHSCVTLLESERNLVGHLRHQNRALTATLRRLQSTEKELDDAEHALQTDVLTGLFNRRFFEEEIGLILRRADEAGDRPALLLLDLDEFKRVNDTHGHSCGDRLLREMADRLRRSLRQTDMPYRIGGDEFAVLLLGIDADKAIERARQLARAVNGFELEVEGELLAIGVSVGGAHYRPGETWTDFFDRADRNLYLVKQEGGAGLAWEGRRIAANQARPPSGGPGWRQS